MNKIILVLVVLVFVGIGAYYLFSQNNSGGALPTASSSATATPTPIVSAIVSATPEASNKTIEIKNFSFSPSTLNIKTGTKVTWINNDSVSHTVTSDSGNLLNSPALSPGQSFSFTFSAPGSVNYHCAIHPMMKANIIVTN